MYSTKFVENSGGMARIVGWFELLTNTKNIHRMYKKGIGIKKKILTILNNFTAGKYNFEIAVILRNAYFISSIL